MNPSNDHGKPDQDLFDFNILILVKKPYIKQNLHPSDICFVYYKEFFTLRVT